MSEIAIVIAEEEADLYAIIEGKNFRIIPETVRQFSGITTYPAHALVGYGQIRGEAGWIALAESI